MPKMLFINPCLRYDAKRRYPPVGLACILTALRAAGFDFDLIDMDAEQLHVDDVAKRVEGKQYDLVGFGCLVTGFSQARSLAEIFRKQMPSCLLVAGNSVATSIPELLLRNTEIDIATLGEGDITIVEIAQAVKERKDWHCIPGIAYLKQDAVQYSPDRPVIKNLDDIPFPDWTIFNLSLYNRETEPIRVGSDDVHPKYFPLNSARGCPFSCTFCYHVFKNNPYRKYSDAAVIQEFIRLKEEFGATRAILWDELSFPSISTVKEFVTELEKLSFTMEYEAVCRSGLFEKEHLDLVKRLSATGCRVMSFSIENASPDILKAMNKKISHDKTVIQAQTLWKGGVTPLTSVIFGYPQETPQTIQATLDLCEQCNIYPSVGFLLPLPGTPIYDWAVSAGHIVDELAYLEHAGDRQDFYINLTQMPDSEFVDCVVSGMHTLAKKFGMSFVNPLKTGVYQAPKFRTVQ